MKITITFDHISTKLGHAIRIKRGVVPLRSAAKHVDVPWPTLARLERGDGIPTSKNFMRLADWLGLKKSEFNKYTNPKKY